MTTNGGITEQVFGFDLLSEHKMKPWWETVHGYLLATTITASGLIIYFTSTGQQVDCLPISENASMFTESQVNLMNGYCAGQIPWYAIYSGVLNFVVASLILVASYMWLNHPDVIDAFRTFIKATLIISGLHSRSKKLNRMAVMPVFAEDGEAFELRKACLLLWFHRNRIQWHYLFRNCLVISMTTLASVGTVTMAILMTDLVINPHFNCTLSPKLKDELHLPLKGHYNYFCSYNYAKIIFPFVLLSATAFLVQILTLAIASFKLRPIAISDSALNVLSDDFLQARAYCHFMKVFWTNASPIDSQRFVALLDYVFSIEAITSMVRFIPKAITNMDTTREENNFLPPYNGPKFRYRSVPNPDLTYVELYVHMHRNGGNNALSQLYKLFESREFGKGYRDIKDALAKVEFAQWNVDAQDFVRAAGERKYWDLVVTILNSFRDSNSSHHPRKLECDFYDFKMEELEYGNDIGNNVLYYALRKEEGEADFKSTAIKHILACNIGEVKLSVINESVKMSAEDFVITQYERDPTFTEELKLQLVSMIKEAEDRHFQYATVKI